MAGPSSISSSSATPTQKTVLSYAAPPRMASNQATDTNTIRDGLQPPRAAHSGLRSVSNASGVSYGPRGSSLAPSAIPGSFSSVLRSTVTQRSIGSRPDLSVAMGLDYPVQDDGATSERALADLKDKLNKEIKIKEGSENLLEALNTKKAKQTKDQRYRVEEELNSSNRKINQLKNEIEALQRPQPPPSASRGRLSGIFRGNPLRPAAMNPSVVGVNRSDVDVESETESPTFTLAEILQSLETEGMDWGYYVERANSLVELLKRHPLLKYDLVWPVFGLRVQMMLLSDSKEVVAAGYRMTRYAITDLKSLRNIRELNTDYLVILSLVKESRASVEREQALKFVRAFMEVKGGVREISRAVLRAVVAIAEHTDDRLRMICIETLAEILIRDPELLLSAGGVGPLIDVLVEGSYGSPETLVGAFLNLYETSSRRKYLRSGHELEVLFSAFTDPLACQGNEQKLRSNAKAIATILKTWSGLLIVSMYEFRALKSLVSAMYFPDSQIRASLPLGLPKGGQLLIMKQDMILELLFDVLRIKSPSWSASFLAGRRLTTYGRVANLKSESSSHPAISTQEDEMSQRSLVEHYSTVVLAVFFEAGLQKALLNVIETSPDTALKRKATLLLGEISKMAGRLLPNSYSASLQQLPELFASASKFGDSGRFISTNAIYQIDSVNRTLERSVTAAHVSLIKAAVEDGRILQTPRHAEQVKMKTTLRVDMDESTFRSLLIDTQVLATINFIKWKWDLISQIVEGPLRNPKRMDEAIRGVKFVKRLTAFYRPFKYRFSEIKNTKPNQRYVRIGCALIHTLLQNPSGVKYLVENKLLRQIAECLAHWDRMSGLTSPSPLFSANRLSETLCGGYFEILGTLSSDLKGLAMMERWRIFNMFYHIVELKDRDDLLQAILDNMDYTFDGHLRVLLSRALTACSKSIRIFATNLLRKYATAQSQPSKTSTGTVNVDWAIRLLVTQLYDPDVEVCGTAVKILEEACNRKHCLEYVVKCRPALDHLGDIGAPLLLRFLSTSVGYHYLHELDYINQAMDDWFLGRNDIYVTIVEASLYRALHMEHEKPQRNANDGQERTNYGIVPPHFYRELTRTTEGCKLLEEKGHFTEFAATIRDFGMEKDDPEIILKVKGCMWAVGNVGSMALGAPFLEESDVVRQIAKIAEESEVMSLKGTAFFVLGLISRSIHGMEILGEYGWDGATTVMGESIGFCVPLELKRLFSIKPWIRVTDKEEERRTALAMKFATTDEEPTNTKILEMVRDLGNTVLLKKNSGDLARLKAKKLANFKDPRLFRKVMTMLECHHYRLPARRFLIDLFDKSVMRQIVLCEESDSETERGANDDSSTNSRPPAPNAA
ncbi:hypothetical protein FGG08_002786 [Glutinoglossum americanum]|uniref:REM-1 domain-containing protein n=1 Tax=Glutinoglossum americanum TaxID=1670608 RepID=A0A9P8I5L3_9PEZI|nr:hypothetical protein FGG08_002786 [Glutinoglossum americanum]